MIKMKNILKKILDKILLTPLKRIIPTQKLIVFESFSDFSDNSKQLFDYMIKEQINSQYKMIWLVEEPEKYDYVQIPNVSFVPFGRPGIINKVKEEVRNVFLSSRCAYYFYTHRHITRTTPKHEQVFFNLTHGLSLKDTRGKLWPYTFNTFTAVTSEFAAELRAKSYDGGLDQMKVTGFPRNDLLLRGNLSIINKYSFTEYEKNVLWMPTFRRQKGTDRNDAGTERTSDIPLIDSSSEWDVVNAFLEKENIRLIIKPHPAQKMEYISQIDSSHICILTNEDLVRDNIELYELIAQSDALISDYSSVYVDYLLTNRPIGFTIDDMTSYSENLGFSVADPLNYMPGPKIATIKELQRFLIDLKIGRDDWKDERSRVRDLFHQFKDDKSSERILKFLKLKSNN